MNLITFFYELSDILGMLTDVDRVLLIPSPQSCKVMCLAEVQISKFQRDIVCVVEAITNETVESLPDTVGILSFRQVCGALKSPGMNRTTATGIFKPTSQAPMLELKDKIGNIYKIALLREALAKEQIKVPPLKKTVTYEVMTAPTESGIALIKHWSSESRKIANDYWIVPFTNDTGQLMFSYRVGLDHSDFAFANAVQGSLAPDWCFRDRAILQLLNLYRTSKSMTFKFCSLGLLTVELQTTLATYLFHISPGKARSLCP